MNEPTLYDRDFLLWTEKQIESLRTGDWEQLDVEHLVEELAALGRSEQKELGSYLQVLLMHLLKYQYQPQRRTRSWKVTISNCRDRIQDCLEDTPSLKHFLQDQNWIQKYYQRARRDAAKETEKPIETFPADCPFSVTQILDPNFLA